MKAAHIPLFIAACCISVHAFAADIPSVSDLLDRYAENQDKLSSFIVKTEETISTKRSKNDPMEHRRMVTEARVDGKKTHIFYTLWRNLPTKDAPTPMSEAANWVDLWDGNIAIQWYYRESEGGSGSGQILRDEKLGKASINGWYSGAPFMGIRYSTFERIDSVLRQAHSISVRNELEQVGSSACYVIDANTASGTYAVWLDPQHGYQVAQAEIRVGPNDRWLATTLGENESRSLSIRNVRFENIDGIWIAMEADIHATSVQPSIGKNLTRDEHHKITQITLNPDHEVLRSFVPVVANGAQMWDMDLGIKYTWREGMKFVVDEWDGRIRYVPEDWSIRVGVGRELPAFEGIELDLSAERAKDKAILLCFLDINQRPSRNCMQQLSTKAKELKAKDIIIVAIQVSKTDESDLSEWIKENNFSFPVGMVQGDQEKTCFTWGVRSLPWLILTDKKHAVTAEGFAINELDEKIKNLNE